MFSPKGSPRRLWFTLAILVATGCGESENANDQPWRIEPGHLRPVSGTITLRGKPLPKAIVAFFSKSGVPSVGETGDDGRYSLQSMNMDGAPPGEYKVAISYLLSPDGEPQGLAARSAMVQSEAMIAARESLPSEYSDANRTKLSTTVGEKGGDGFNFDIEATPQAPERQQPGSVESDTGDPQAPAPPDTDGEKPPTEEGTP